MVLSIPRCSVRPTGTDGLRYAFGIRDQQVLQLWKKFFLLKQKFGNCSEWPVKSLAESCFLVNAIEQHRQGPPLSKSVENNFGTMESETPPSPPSSNNASLLPLALFYLDEVLGMIFLLLAGIILTHAEAYLLLYFT